MSAELICKDKIPFKTKPDALGAAALARHRYGSSKYKAYKCKHCGDWHLARELSEDSD